MLHPRFLLLFWEDGERLYAVDLHKTDLYIMLPYFAIKVNLRTCYSTLFQRVDAKPW